MFPFGVGCAVCIESPQSATDIGVPAYWNEQELTFGKLLKMPFGPQHDWRLPDGNKPGRK